MKKLFLKNRSFRFRRFTNKAYSAFASLHLAVTIGAVKAYVTEREMLKQGISVAAMLAMLLGFGSVQAAETEGESSGVPLTDAEQLRLQEVLVVSQKAAVHSQGYRLVTSVSREEIAVLPVQTVADILQYLPGLDVRTRGANGGQADLSMRGGTFDQVLVLLNGVPISDAHTGHYSLNLPVSKSLIERVEVLQGTGAGLFGAFSGAVNIVTTAPVDAPSATGQLALTAGMYGLINPELSGRWQTKHGVQMAASAEYVRAEGYDAPDAGDAEQEALRNTDLKVANIYYSLQAPMPVKEGSEGRLMAQFGLQYKDAGAGMFYGWSPDQFDATRTAFGSADYLHRWGAWSLEAQAAYRANYDRYEWHRNQRLYGNFHFSQTTSAAVKTHYASRIGKTTLGVEFRNENLHSTNLGDTINPEGQVPNVADFDLKEVRVLDLVKGKNRMQVGYFAEQSFCWQQLSASMGFNGLWNSMFGNQFGGGVNLGYEYARNSSVYVNANRSLRLPTFTDLYYNAGNQLGNKDLQPETAWLLSVGTKYQKRLGDASQRFPDQRISLAADAYYRFGRNIIDWVYVPEDAKRHHAMNQQKVDAAGLEATVSYHLNEWLREVSVNYAYTWLSLDLKEAGSRYLDNLSHKLVLHVNHAFCVLPHEAGVIGGSWTLRFQKREGQYTPIGGGEPADYEPITLLDGSVYYQHSKVRVSVDCTNMTNRHYYDYGGILQPGAWAKLSVSAKL